MKNFYTLLALALTASACAAAPEDVDFSKDPSCTTGPTGQGGGGTGGSGSSSGGAGGGCTGEAEGPLEGSRLKHRKFYAEDGSVEIWDGWYDTVRQENCTFRQMVNGGMRCVPMDDVVFTRVFLDAECTIPVAIPDEAAGYCSYSNMPKPHYVEWTSGNSCWVNTPIHVGELEDTPFFPDLLYRQRIDGQCGNGIANSDPTPFYKLKTELSPVAFVGEGAQ